MITLINAASAAVVKTFSSSENSKGTLLYADEVHHDNENDILTARGNVEIEQDGRILWADVVTYNEKTEIMTATGHVRLDEGLGDIVYLDYAEFGGDFKTGFVNKVRMTLTDNSRMVANRGNRENAEISHLDQVVYSPCNLCKTDPTKPPFWQLKAKHAELDEVSENISYTDAFIEILGVPILYTPYLSHPSPNVKRRTGLLNIAANATPALGWFSTAEYFWAISDDKDMTLMPLIQTNGHGIMALEYRQRFERGQFIFKGSLDPGSSIINPESEQKTKGLKAKESDRIRWHLAPEINYDFTTHTRGGLKIERASDSSYLRRYPNLGYPNSSFLTSHIYGEGFWNRNYGVIQGYSFQGLREGDEDKTTPLLFPWITINYLGQPDKNGGRFSLDSDAIVLTREEGAKYGRLSTTGGWQKKYLTTYGEDYTFGAKLRGDLYNVHGFRPKGANDSSRYNGNVARFFPQAYANWAYPFLRNSQDYRVILEPLVGVVVAPAKSPMSTKIPNEDSGAIEFSDANVMNESRFSGLDRIDGGSRLNYGFNMAGFSNKSASNIGFFVGQSIAVQKPGAYLAKTGLDKQVSDIVARVKYNYQDWLSVKTRFLLKRNKLPDFRFYRNETSASLGKPILTLTANYNQLPILSDNPKDLSDKQLVLILSSAFYENWSANLTTTRNLGKKAYTLSQGVSLTYQNECFTLSNTLTKSFFNDNQDLKPGLIYMFRVNFKNLGEFSQPFRLNNTAPGSSVQGL
ncbi:MAG: LPS-assembly protein LptD [Janthinobacterium lividum]